MDKHLITYAEHLERQAEAIHQQSKWADGGAYSQDRAEVSRLMNEAGSLRRRANPEPVAPISRQTDAEYRAWLDKQLSPAIEAIKTNNKKEAA